jgi:hypothetical protein
MKIQKNFGISDTVSARRGTCTQNHQNKIRILVMCFQKKWVAVSKRPVEVAKQYRPKSCFRASLLFYRNL